MTHFLLNNQALMASVGKMKNPKSLGLRDPTGYHLANANGLVNGGQFHPLGMGRADGGRLHIANRGVYVKT